MLSQSLSVFSGAVLIALLFAPAALAQSGDCTDPHCGPYSEDPGDSCLGPDDPFCDDGGGGGWGSWERCQRCFFDSANMELKCGQVKSGDGRSECRVYLEGTKIICETWGAFCTVVTING